MRSFPVLYKNRKLKPEVGQNPVFNFPVFVFFAPAHLFLNRFSQNHFWVKAFHFAVISGFIQKPEIETGSRSKLDFLFCKFLNRRRIELRGCVAPEPNKAPRKTGKNWENRKKPEKTGFTLMEKQTDPKQLRLGYDEHSSCLTKTRFFFHLNGPKTNLVPTVK